MKGLTSVFTVTALICSEQQQLIVQYHYGKWPMEMNVKHSGIKIWKTDEIKIADPECQSMLGCAFSLWKTVIDLGMGHLTSWLVEGVERDSGSLSLLWIVNRLCYNWDNERRNASAWATLSTLVLNACINPSLLANPTFANTCTKWAPNTCSFNG